MTEIVQPIPARLKNISIDGHVAGTEDIVDDAKGMTQQEINTSVEDAIGDDETEGTILGRIKALEEAEPSTEGVEKVKVGDTEYSPVDGTVSLPAYPTTLPASDVYDWAKAASKPSYTKSEIGLGNVTNDAQVKRSEMGAASGVATLDSAGKVPASQLPSYIDDVLEYDTKQDFPATGEAGKIYVDKSTNTTWRWSGSAYTQIKGDLVIGTTTGTAADGGVANTHYNNTSNPHSVTKAQVGLGSVVNTGDSATPVSGGTTKFTTGGAYTELAKKVDKVDGKGLSTNDYTTDEKNKLAGIAAGAEVNVQSDWNATSGDAFIKNKPTIPAAAANGIYTVKTLVGSTTTDVSDFTANQSSADDVTFVQGSNVTITPDATNRKITIAATDTKYTAATAAPGKVASSSAQGSSTNYARQDHTHGIDLATGDSNGQVKIAGTNVSVKGLGSAAYTNSTDYRKHVVAEFIGGGSSDGCCLVCTLTITETYVNKPIEIVLDERGKSSVARLNILFNSVNNTDPTLTSFRVCATQNDYYIHKSATSTWKVYATKNESWSQIKVVDYSDFGGVTITWDMANATLPSGATQATHFYSGSDTKNTAGTTNKTGTKMFLAAATSQAANPQTYSNSNCYIGTDNCLYSGGAKVLTAHDGNNRKAFYGTCETAADTKDKVVTLAESAGWPGLVAGVIVGVKFTNTNSYSSATDSPITLDVNSTGAKNIWYGTTHSGAGNTGTNTTAYGRANYVNYYMYDGTYWAWLSSSADANTTYSAGTAALLEAGTNTTNRVWQAKIIANYVKDIAYTLTRHTRLTDFDLNVLKQAAADQNLEKYGLKVGDQKTINGRTYVIADLNTMKGTTTPYRITQNHVGLLVIPHTEQKWNKSGNTYTGADGRGAGYANSDLHYYLVNTLLPLVKGDLGATNLLAHSKLLSNAVNQNGYNKRGEATGCSSGWGWVADQYICALSEVQVYGSAIWSSSGFDTGEACRQLEVFQKYSHTEILGDEYPWLRDVLSASLAAFVYPGGSADYGIVSTDLSVAALVLFH